jgi:pimeloyl-ACP methyl ester carboxylesterase
MGVDRSRVHSAMHRPERPPGVADASIRTLEHDACTFAYRVRGVGAPVVFVQGVGLHGDGWAPQVDALCADHACLSFDHRGMGGSQPQGGAFTVERLASDVLALMDAQGWRSAHLVGHSLGALVALEVAAAAPERARSLALLCGVARGRDATRPTWPIVRLGLAAALGTARARRHAFLRLVLPPSARRGADLDALAASLAPSFGHDLAEQPAVVDAQLRALRGYDARQRIPSLPALPVLVVSAEHDPIAPPRFGRALASAITGAQFACVPDAAHGVTLQRSDEVNALLRTHVAQA